MNFLKKANINHDKKNKSHIPFRLNFLFFVVFILFAALIVQLAYLQIVFGPRFESKLKAVTQGPKQKMFNAGWFMIRPVKS